MSRVIAIHQGPDGRRRPGPPKRDDRFAPVIDLMIASGRLGVPTLVPVRYTPDRETAAEVASSLYNAARYYCSCSRRNCTRRHPNIPAEGNPEGGCPDGGRRVGARVDLVRHNGALRVQFTFFDKKEAMREVVAKYGPDPANWPYNPRAKRMKG
jgi:hypothetical protein